MPKSDDDDARGLSADLKRFLIVAIGGMSLLFLSAMTAGYIVGAIETGGLDLYDLPFLAVFGLLIAIIGFVCWKTWPAASDEVVSPSTRKSNRLILLMAGLGVVLAIVIVPFEDDPGFAIFSNSPLNPVAAIIAIAIWGAATPVITWLWWRAVDEHEASAYTDGALVAGHFYIIGAPVWWLAARAGWVPHQDPMTVFFIVVTIWTAVWFYRRYV